MSNHNFFALMDTLVTAPRTKSDARFLKILPNRRSAKVIEVGDNFEAIVTRRLFEEELVDTATEATQAVAAVKDFARSRGLSLNVIGVDELLEEYEDMVLGRIMEERRNDPDNGRVAESEIMAFLEQ